MDGRHYIWQHDFGYVELVRIMVAKKRGLSKEVCEQRWQDVIEFGHSEVVKILLAKGANTETADMNRTPHAIDPGIKLSPF